MPFSTKFYIHFCGLYSTLSLLLHSNLPCFSLYLHCCEASVIRNTAFIYIYKSLHVCPRLNRGTRSARSFYFKNIYFLMYSVGCVRNRPNTGTEKSPISYEIKK